MHLITGGLGFIGNELVRQFQLIAKGDILDGLIRLEPSVLLLRSGVIFESTVTAYGERNL
jgi:nucleoside-diphosphate-sugar epimerase